MPDSQRHLDIGSWLVILVTLVLFVAALFFKGFGHDLLLEAGVFLVSVKLVMMAYKSSLATRQVNDRLDGLQTILTRMESRLESRCSPELAAEPPERADPTGAGAAQTKPVEETAPAAERDRRGSSTPRRS